MMFPKVNKDFFYGKTDFFFIFCLNIAQSIPIPFNIFIPDRSCTRQIHVKHTLPSVALVIGSGCISGEGRILITGPRKLRTGCVNVCASPCH